MLDTSRVADFIEKLSSRWGPLFRSKEWRKRLAAWGTSFEGVIDYLRRRHVEHPAGHGNDDPLFLYFLMELKKAMMEISPSPGRAREIASVCEDLAAAPLQELRSLFATCVLEGVLAKSEPWRGLFFRNWAHHGNPHMRCSLAFATCFTELADKKKLLLDMANDSDESVRTCVLQSLIYRDRPYPLKDKPAVNEILKRATRSGGDGVAHMAALVRKLV